MPAYSQPPMPAASTGSSGYPGFCPTCVQMGGSCNPLLGFHNWLQWLTGFRMVLQIQKKYLPTRLPICYKRTELRNFQEMNCIGQAMGGKASIPSPKMRTPCSSAHPPTRIFLEPPSFRRFVWKLHYMAHLVKPLVSMINSNSRTFPSGRLGGATESSSLLILNWWVSLATSPHPEAIQ